MIGIPIDRATRVFCDSEAVFKNSSIALSFLKKKNNTITYHRVREDVAAGIINIYKKDSESNLADILTKPLLPTKRKYSRKKK